MIGRREFIQLGPVSLTGAPVDTTTLATWVIA